MATLRHTLATLFVSSQTAAALLAIPAPAVLAQSPPNLPTLSKLGAGGYLATGDLDGDGRSDVVSMGSLQNAQLPYGFTVFLARSEGGFAEPIVSPTASADAVAVFALADMDND